MDHTNAWNLKSFSLGVAALTFVGCGMSASETARAPSSAASRAPSAPVIDSPTAVEPARGGQGRVQSGVLTAGAWDDNQNYDLFDEFRAKVRDQAKLPSSEQEHEDAAQQAANATKPHQALDVALVIDTTGSMGDEIRYLQAEFAALSKRIASEFSQAEQRWALILYRDRGDDYVTRVFDFSDDAQAFAKHLQQQSAGGGGDYPEAPDQAFAAMRKLSWRMNDETARMTFWVADAPHHAERAGAMLDEIRHARDLGVHVYPVASSGVNDLTELTMRSAAQLTGGRYLFLTDDSGVGLDHKEPRIPCYFVTHLNDAMLRMIEIELSGEYRAPEELDIIRTAGDPHDGECQLQSGDIAVAY